MRQKSLKRNMDWQPRSTLYGDRPLTGARGEIVRRSCNHPVHRMVRRFGCRMEPRATPTPTHDLPPISWPRHLLRTGLMAFGLTATLGIGLVLITGPAFPYGESILLVSIACFVCLWPILILVIWRSPLSRDSFLTEDFGSGGDGGLGA